MYTAKVKFPWLSGFGLLNGAESNSYYSMPAQKLPPLGLRHSGFAGDPLCRGPMTEAFICEKQGSETAAAPAQ